MTRDRDQVRPRASAFSPKQAFYIHVPAHVQVSTNAMGIADKVHVGSFIHFIFGLFLL